VLVFYVLASADRIFRNSSLGSQTGYNALADGMLSQIQWWHDANNYKLEIFSKLNFVRAFMQWKNSRQMNQYIGAELDKRHAEYKADPESAKGVSIMDMVLRAYLSETPSPPAHLDAEFRASVIRQIRLFVFAGHDSTATSIVYTFHLLSKHPEVLARLRAEHDDVLGPDPKAAASKISDDPRLVNSLTYTLAVIKEAMRLFPPAGASRDGVSGVNITDDAGNSCPTDDTILWVLHGELHQGDKYWVKAQEFLPERWMVPPGHLLYPRPGTWRSFEVGPRNCIAQAMVLIELRVVLACLVRTFDVTPAYGEWDEKRGATGNRHVRGERVYQIERGAADPVGGYPCRITLAKPSTK
jgi:cytochrome P450